MIPRFDTILITCVNLLLSGEIIVHVVDSIKIVLTGFLIAAVFGFLLGLVMYLSDTAERLLLPVIDMVRGVAALALLPLFIIVLGIGFQSKVIIIFWTAWTGICLNTVNGLRNVPKEIIEAARLEGATESMILRRISIPVAGSIIMTGLRIGMSGGWISLVAAEMLGSNTGLGFFVMMKSQTFDFVGMYAAILYISMIGLIFNQVLFYIERAMNYEN